MNQKKLWMTVLGVGGGLMLVNAFLIWSSYGEIASARENVTGLHDSIDASRKLLAQTSALERDVIVLRETEEAIKEILPDEQDLNNFVRDLRSFEEESGVRITGLKKKADPGVRKGKDTSTDFEKVTYQLSIEADAFQWLAFLDRVESHSRFMTVPSFKLAAAARHQVESGKEPYAHKIQMDIETYVYAPQGALSPVKVDGYQRKRELLLGEIARHKSALAIQTYQFRGQRNRRDPWVDPRISVQQAESEGQIAVEVQIQMVADLVARADEVEKDFDAWKTAENDVDKKLKRAELEKKLASLEEDVRRTLEAGSISFAPSKNALDHQVAERIAHLRESMTVKEDGKGVNIDELSALVETMHHHMQSAEYDLALAAFSNVEPRLPPAEQDPQRKPLVDEARAIAKDAKIATDFGKLELKIGGVMIAEGSPPVALINGRALSEGDMVDSDLIIRSIHRDEIEFIFRGVILLRKL